MKNENINLFYEKMEDLLNDDDRIIIYDTLSNLDFKLHKNQYHLNNMLHLLNKELDMEDENMYDNIIFPLYFEFESLLVSLRSAVDILMKIANHLFDFKLQNMDLTLYNIYKHPKLPKNLKNIMDRYTRSFNNPNWTFIYTSRNEIVHSTSIDSILPINLEFDTTEKPLAFFEWENKEREMGSFLGNSIRFLENFSSEFLRAIHITYIKQ